MIESINHAFVYFGDAEDYVLWETVGVPSMTIKISKADTAAITCSSTVNRIQNCIKSRPGYVTIDEWGPLV